MATPTDTPSPGDIWHLSIDDLFALPEAPRLGGEGPFVINLSASTVPITLPKGALAGTHPAVVYQIQRTEDRRVRYRLRLGPFASEDDADGILGTVRNTYPGALTATADEDDLRAIAAARPKTTALKSLPSAIALHVAQPPASTIPLTLSPPLPSTKPLEPVQAAAPTKPLGLPPSAVPPTLPASAVVRTARKAAPAQPTVGPAAPIAPVIDEQISTHVLTLQTTQTVRALTPKELKGDEVLRWFVIQLSLAPHPFDPETVPDLDIFSVYRLYSVAGMDQGQILHALRLGFFAEESAAKAVASYLGAFYDAPIIKRVSVAERDRFADQRLEPRKNVGATGKHASIEITDERFVRQKRAASAAVRKAPGPA